MMDITPTYRVHTKNGPLTRMQGWCKQDFRGTSEAKVEEELVEVKDSWFATILEDQDTMPMI